jgi:hypothetical protein
MKRKYTRLFALLMVMIVFGAFGALGITSFALATGVTADATTSTTFDWGTLLTQIVVWVIGALAAVAAWALKKYVYPWFVTVVVPWLKTHNLIALAEMAVKYAEAQLGRYTGPEKWALALSLMKAKGYNINSEEVLAALKAAWETLDLQQITAGVKSANNEQPISTPTET